MNQRLFFTLAVSMVMACLAGAALAADINVPGDQPTIQAAISAANPDDTVIVADGIYTGAGNVNLDFGGKVITVRSENGPDNCTIDCQNIDSTRGFYFHTSEGNSSIVDGFTITNGNVPTGEWGGGILCTDGASPTIRNCVITGCFATNYGGAIYCRVNSSPIIEDCVMNGNSTLSGGGAIGCYDNSNPTIRNCTMTNNQATSTTDPYGYGGAITIKGNPDTGQGCAPIIEGCTITGNTARSSGGGIYMETNITATVTGCTITGNTAGYDGGGICCVDSSPIITNCSVENNTATNDGRGGGGIYLSGNASATVTNCLIRGNQGRWGAGITVDGNNSPQVTNCLIVGNISIYNGGGIMPSNGNRATFANCTIAGNTASQNGGGIYVYNQDGTTTTNITLNNCIIWGNTAATGGSGDGHQFYTFTHSGGSSTVTLNYCDYSDGLGDYGTGFLNSGTGHFTPDANCITDDPLFTGAGDYHLQDTSPCIDAGLDSYVSGVTEDFDGNPRVLGVSVDMGPYEANVDSPMVSVTTPASPTGSPVTIIYDLSDPQGDTCTVSFDYSVDSGTTWASCTAGSGDTNPQTSVATPASGLTFAWDATADLTSQIIDVMVRVSADDGNGHTGWDTTAEFTVIDLQPPPNFSGTGCATDQIDWTWNDAVGPTAYLLEDEGGNPVASIPPGVQSYTETILSGENTPATRLLRSSTSATTEVTVEPAGPPSGATLPWRAAGYHAQFLYTAAEIFNTEGAVKKIYWQRFNAGPIATYDDVSATLGHTTKTSLDDNCASNFDVDGSELVRDPASYRPPEALTAREWVELPFDRSFYYNGTDNLIIDIDVASGTDSIAWTEMLSTAGDTSLYGNPGSPIGTPWDRKFPIRLEMEVVVSLSGPATAIAYTLIHDATIDELLLELSVSGTEVVITITEPPNAHAGLTGVKIERATNDTFTQDATSLQDFTDNYSYTDAGVSGGTEYWYRITFCNGDGTASAESPGESISVLGSNTPPVALITAPTGGSHTGDIQVAYDLRDYDSDPAEIAVHFSLDSGATWTTCTMGSGGDGTTPLATNLTGTSHLYVWDSDTDGVGTPAAEAVQLRIIPSDKDGTGVQNITSFNVNNAPQGPPTVVITDPTSGTHGDDITITYTLTDVNADDCDMTVEYSTDGGSSWDPCTPGTGGDGTSGLDSSPTGTSHTFVWASRTNLPDVLANVTLQVIADDGNAGTGSDISTFSVDNAAAITAHFVGSPVSGPAALTVQFTDQSVGGITAWSWDFGDGSTSTQQNPSHQFGGGTHTVSLTVTGPSGSNTETRTGYITVAIPPSKKSGGGGCGCRVDRTATPLNELLGFFLPVMLVACAYLALRRRRAAA